MYLEYNATQTSVTMQSWINVWIQRSLCCIWKKKNKKEKNQYEEIKYFFYLFLCLIYLYLWGWCVYVWYGVGVVCLFYNYTGKKINEFWKNWFIYNLCFIFLFFIWSMRNFVWNFADDFLLCSYMNTEAWNLMKFNLFI